MSIKRVPNPERGYTIVLNDIFFRKDLSYRAKGLYCQMWSLPDNWIITTTGLVTMSKDGKDAVASALQELESAGFMRRTRMRCEEGTFAGTDFELFQSPQPDLPAPVNPPLLNTPLLDSNRVDVYEGSMTILPPGTPIPKQPIITPSKHKHGAFNNVLLTDQEYTKLQAKFPDLAKRIENLSSYIESKGVTYKSHYATLLRWADMDQERKAEKKAAEPVPKYQQFLDLAKELENEQS